MASRTSPRSCSAHASPESARTRVDAAPSSSAAGARGPEGVDRLVVAMGCGQRLRALELRLELRPVAGGHARRDEGGIDPEPLGEPADRGVGRPRLAALDLTDVLLREPFARELALRETRGDAQRAYPLAEASRNGGALAEASARCRRERRDDLVHSRFSQFGFEVVALPREGDARLPLLSELTVAEIT